MKVKLTYQWFAIGIDGVREPGEPVGEHKTILIDTEVNHKYDGSQTLEDVTKTFLESHTPDPMHSVELKVTGCMQV